MRNVLAVTVVATIAAFAADSNAQTKVVIGYSGWTGFARTVERYGSYVIAASF